MDLSGVLTRVPIQGRPRALVKTLVYRVVMVAITIAVAFVFTQNTSEALNIGIVTNVVKTGTYYGYERLWDRIAWGVEAP